MTDKLLEPTGKLESGLGGTAVALPEHVVSDAFIEQLRREGAPEALIDAIVAGNLDETEKSS